MAGGIVPPNMRISTREAVFASLVLAAVPAACAGCDREPSGTGTWIGLISSGDVLSRADRFRVWAFDAAVQRCAGDAVPDPRGPALASTGDVAPGATARMDVPPGARTFYAEVYGVPGVADLLATGCSEQVLAPGERTTVLIRLSAVGEDGGDGDADVPDDGRDVDDADSTDHAEDDAAEEAGEDMEVEPDAAEDAADADDEAPDAEGVPEDVEDAPDDRPGDADADAAAGVHYSCTFAATECTEWRTAALRGINDWQCGTGAGEPDRGSDGAGGVLGTRLGGNYSDRSDCYAQSPSIDASGGSGPLRLTFRHWMQGEGIAGDCTGSSANNDGGLVEASGGGAPFAAVAPHGGYPLRSLDAFFSGGPAYVDGRPGFACRSGDPLPAPPRSDWERECFDVTAFRTADVRIRFYFGSDSTANARGWYIDEVVVEDGECP